MEAAAAEAQLEGDVAQVKGINGDRRHFNELVMSVLAYATGKDRGPTPKDWREAVKGKNADKNYETQKPVSVTELIPLAYQPSFVQLSFMRVRIIEDS